MSLTPRTSSLQLDIAEHLAGGGSYRYAYTKMQELCRELETELSALKETREAERNASVGGWFRRLFPDRCKTVPQKKAQNISGKSALSSLEVRRSKPTEKCGPHSGL